ncbi:MAG: SDR family oxidoreductase [Saprospiraceae bacterium]
MKVSIKGKTALVSGANRGIGKAITETLLDNGAKKVYAGARNVASLNDLKTKYGDRLIAVELDVTKDESIANAASTAGDIDILVNNAGVMSPGNFTNGNMLESMKTNFEVNVWGLTKLTNAFFNQMKKSESAAIVSISSVAGLANMPLISTYSASKAAVHSIVQGLRGELSDSNVLVCGVYPGPIDTDMAKGIEMEKDSPENVARNILQAIEEGVEDVFPDAMSKQVGAGYMASPKAIETQFGGFVS